MAGWEKEGELATTGVMNDPLKFLRVDVCKYRPEVGKMKFLEKSQKNYVDYPRYSTNEDENFSFIG